MSPMTTAFTTKISGSTIRSFSRNNLYQSCRPLHSTIPNLDNPNNNMDSVNNRLSITRFSGKKYEPDNETLRPLIVCGPSGVGKGTIIANYMKNFPFAENFGFTTSHTTRDPRPGERDGVDYHFTNKKDMEEAIAAGKFIEYAQVHGNIYGTSFEAMRDVQDTLQKICLLDIDVQGVKNIKNHEKREEFPRVEGNFIFIAPPSMEILEDRLKGRGTETPESLERRTRNAQAEMDYGMEDGNFDHIVVNADLDQACKDFDAAVKAIYYDLL